MSNIKSLSEVLTENAGFAGKILKKDQTTLSTFEAWTEAVKNLHRIAYNLYADCENDTLTENDLTSMDTAELFNAIHNLLMVIGEVNGHKLHPTAKLATQLIGYAGTRKNVKAEELRFCEERIRTREREIQKLSEINGTNPDYIQKLKNEVTELKKERDTLLDTADQKTRKPTRTTDNAFRLDVENRIARAITTQKAKTWEELEEERKQRNKEKRERSKTNKKSK